MDVASGLPAATEILYALGVEPALVSPECDHPPAATDRPRAYETRIDTTGSSQAISERVTAETATGEGLYAFQTHRLLEVDPDVFVTQGGCEVCALETDRVLDYLEDLPITPEIVSIHPHSLADVLDAIERIGAATETEERARALTDALSTRIDHLRARTPQPGPRVAVLDWLQPVMVAGHWIPEMVELAGGEYGMADRGDRSTPREFGALLEYDPEVLIVAPCGFSLEQTMAHVDDLTDRDGYDSMTAVREGQVYAIDGDQYINRPGPRLIDALEFFGSLLFDEVFGEPPNAACRRLPPPMGSGS